MKSKKVKEQSEIKEKDRVIKWDKKGILASRNAVREGSLVVFPTETVYGIGADATNDKAVANIFAAKGRPKFNPLIVHVASINAAKDIAKFSPIAEKLAEKFWPGALTLILERKDDCQISSLVSCGLTSIAVRIPSHPIAQTFLKTVLSPIAAPSANQSGRVSPTSIDHVLKAWPNGKELGPKIIIDGGRCGIGLESTVIDLTTEQITVLRPGGITLESLKFEVNTILFPSIAATSPKAK